jgi:hypothetical protein
MHNYIDNVVLWFIKENTQKLIHEDSNPNSPNLLGKSTSSILIAI